MPRKGQYKIKVGDKFGDWTVLRFSDLHNQQAYWICRCRCGRDCRVNGTNLRAGTSKSCGCYKTDFSLLHNINRDIVFMYDAGLSCGRIARELGYSESWINEIVRRHGTPRNHSMAKFLATPAKSLNEKPRRRAARRKGKVMFGDLLPTVDIHHIDEDYTNNSPDNLMPLDEITHAKYNAAVRRWKKDGISKTGSQTETC